MISLFINLFIYLFLFFIFPVCRTETARSTSKLPSSSLPAPRLEGSSTTHGSYGTNVSHKKVCPFLRTKATFSICMHLVFPEKSVLSYGAVFPCIAMLSGTLAGPTDELKDRVVVVTGANTGVGKQVAKQLAAKVGSVERMSTRKRALNLCKY